MEGLASQHLSLASFFQFFFLFTMPNRRREKEENSAQLFIMIICVWVEIRLPKDEMNKDC